MPVQARGSWTTATPTALGGDVRQRDPRLRRSTCIARGWRRRRVRRRHPRRGQDGPRRRGRLGRRPRAVAASSTPPRPAARGATPTSAYGGLEPCRASPSTSATRTPSSPPCRRSTSRTSTSAARRGSSRCRRTAPTSSWSAPSARLTSRCGSTSAGSGRPAPAAPGLPPPRSPSAGGRGSSTTSRATTAARTLDGRRPRRPAHGHRPRGRPRRAAGPAVLLADGTVTIP